VALADVVAAVKEKVGEERLLAETA